MFHDVHGLCYLASDIKHLGPLNSWSAFCFENFMSVLKKLVRKRGNPLKQLCNRPSEQEHDVEVWDSSESNHFFKTGHDTGLLIATCRSPQCKKTILANGITLSLLRIAERAAADLVMVLLLLYRTLPIIGLVH